MYKRCLEIATEAHKGQTRWNGTVYINHPIAVASKFKNERLKCIAVLHDVIEDSDYDRQLLSAKGIRGDITAVVEVLSKQKGESYKDFILRICENEDAVKVKVEDIKHNLLDLKKGSMKDKYELALLVLDYFKNG